MIYPIREEDPELDASAGALAMAFGVEYCLPAGTKDSHSQVLPSAPPQTPLVHM